MKTSFKNYLQESNLPKAKNIVELRNSIVDGKFTLDGADLILDDESSDEFMSVGLKSLVGFPSIAMRSVNCSYNEITTLVGVPSDIGSVFAGGLYVSNNKITSLKNIHLMIKKIRGSIILSNNPIESHILGLLKIEGLKTVVFDDKKLQGIINYHLTKGDLFACQQELIDAGFEAYAQL